MSPAPVFHPEEKPKVSGGKYPDKSPKMQRDLGVQGKMKKGR